MPVREIEITGFSGPDAFDFDAFDSPQNTASDSGFDVDASREDERPASEPVEDGGFIVMSAEDSQAFQRHKAEEWALYQRAAQDAKQRRLEAEKARERGEFEVEPTRVYTQNKDRSYKYWGIREPNMTVAAFWAINDPYNSRNLDDGQDLEPLAESELAHPHQAKPSSRTGKLSKRSTSKPTPAVNANPRVRKSAKADLSVNQRSRRSLAHEVVAGHQRLEDQVREVKDSNRRGPQPVTCQAGSSEPESQVKMPVTAPGNMSEISQEPLKKAGRGRPRKSQPEPVNVKPSRAADPVPEANGPASSSSLKRKRGRPTKKKPSTESSGKQKRPASESKAKVTKSKQNNKILPAPSSHKMRTRTRGPAEHIKLT